MDLRAPLAHHINNNLSEKDAGCPSRQHSEDDKHRAKPIDSNRTQRTANERPQEDPQEGTLARPGATLEDGDACRKAESGDNWGEQPKKRFQERIIQAGGQEGSGQPRGIGNATAKEREACPAEGSYQESQIKTWSCSHHQPISQVTAGSRRYLYRAKGCAACLLPTFYTQIPQNPRAFSSRMNINRGRRKPRLPRQRLAR
jgi:hypothetical protein